jgi:serine phosphatase RsbU (regulator of sigma subunit)
MIKKFNFIFCLKGKIMLLFLLFFNYVLSQSNAKQLVEQAAEVYSEFPDSSFKLCLEAEKLNDEKVVIDICGCKAKYYLLFTDYENAEIEITNGINLSKKNNDYNNLSYFYSLKSIQLERIGEIDQSHYVLLESYKISKEHGSPAQQHSRLSNLTASYLRRNHLDSALMYFKEMELLSGLVEQSSIYYYFQNFGKYYFQLNEFEVALEYLFKAEKIAYDENMIDSRATVLTYIADSYLQLNNIVKAEEAAYLSYAVSHANNLIFEKSDAIKSLINIMEFKKDYLSAFKLQKEYLEVEKEIFNIEKLSKVKAVENKLALIEKENEITQQSLVIEEQKVEKANSEIKSQRLYLILIIISILMVLVAYIYLRTKKLNRAINAQKMLVEEKNKEITDSINYAQRIQKSILPSDNTIDEHLKNGFVLYKPKDVVSGDFYWLEKHNDEIYIAAADCTGHGVPGAMVSVICSNALSKALLEEGITETGKLLDRTRELVIDKFAKSSEEMKDGMDISLCRFSKNRIQWSGANNPLWIVRNEQLIDYKADKQPVGKYANPTPFTTHNIEILESDTIYFFTDGFADQFGGPKGKKFMYRQFKDLIVSLEKKPMIEQKEILNKAFEKWRGNMEQVDDVCIIGIRL